MDGDTLTKVVLLEQLKLVTEAATVDLIMPTPMQKGDTEQQYRAAEVHLARLPDSRSAQKVTPYILHQIITSKDAQLPGDLANAQAVVRSIFGVYNDNEEDGGLMLLNLMERVRIQLLKQTVIGNQFELDLEAGLEALVYPDDTAPYYVGEMVSTWKLPPIKREVTWS